MNCYRLFFVFACICKFASCSLEVPMPSRCMWFAMNSCLSLAVLLAGCTTTTGPKTEPVTGTVTLDGKPLAGAQVVFQPKSGGQAASGTTDAQGKFTLTTFNAKDGAAVGSY